MPDTFTPEQIAQILEEFFKVVGTRQYIGARYVPIFGRKDETSIEWDNSAPYEPLTIVLYQGNSYTSRQYVPVGVEITNQEFWALTGNYNAQVEQYRRDVYTFDGRITANTTAIETETQNRTDADTALGTRITNETAARTDADTALGTRITNETTARTTADTALDTRITTNAGAIGTETQNRTAADAALSDRITNNATDISNLVKVNIKSGGKALGFGDSITAGYGLSDVSKSWFNRACVMLGLTPYNFAVSGSAFSRSGAFRIATQPLTAAASSEFNNNDIEYVFLSGGLNDREGTVEDIQAGIGETINNIRTNFPNAKIYTVPNLAPHLSINSIDQGDHIYLHHRNITAVNNYLRRYSNVYTFTDAWRWLNGDGALTQADNIHPSDSGAQVIANCVVNSIFGANSPACMFFYEGKPDNALADYVNIDKSNYYVMSDGYTWRIHGALYIKAGATLPGNSFIGGTGNIVDGYQDMIIPCQLIAYSHPEARAYIRSRAIRSYEAITNSGNSDTPFYIYATGPCGY